MTARRYITILLLTALPILSLADAGAQNPRSALRFEYDSWDFGVVSEAEGPVTHVFTFRNVSERAVVIERVNADCGCTTPKYSNAPVRPGREGTIEVVFDPAGYSGRFSKMISIFSDNGKSRNNITVSGKVQSRERSTEEVYLYPVAGGIRADRMRVPFEYLENGSSTSMVVGIVNTSPARVRLGISVAADGSGKLIAAGPVSLAPGERGSVTLTYDLTSGAPVYGMLSDRVMLTVNGVRSELSISAHAIAIDDFSNIDPFSVAGCFIEPSFYNFGKGSPGSVHTKEVSISNTGTGPLIVRSVAPRNSSQCDLPAGTVIRPGGTLKFNVTVTARTTAGITSGGATIITNDPERPMREIRATVETVK